jgi:hypothetical protein
MSKSKPNAAAPETKADADQGVSELATGDTEQTSTEASPDELHARDIESTGEAPVASLGAVQTQAEDPAAADDVAVEGEQTVVEVDERRVLPLTRGRVVYYTAGSDDRPFYGQGPMTAHVVEVYGDRKVNLLVAHPLHGDFQRRNDVIFRQPDDEQPDLSFAEWMPFQVQQAKA